MRIFVANIFPKDKILKYGVSIAAHNFCYNLIEGDVFDRVFSILSMQKVEKKDLVYDSSIIQAIYCSFFKKGKIAFRLASFLENIKLFTLIPEKSNVWFYNLSTLTVLLFILLRTFKPSVKLYVIILDFTPGRKGLRGISENILLRWLNRADGIIKLADSPLFTCKNAGSLPGVVPVDSPIYPRIVQIKKEFLISGVLSENISMLSMLLEAFSKMPDMTLHITGKALDLELINEYAGKYYNIVYHGMVSYDDYLMILHDTPFLLSTRDPYSPENQCNFPSKIIEALLHNRIIISTLHYNQLEGINYWKVSSNENDFINDIRKIIEQPTNILLKYANQSDLVKQKYNVGIWKQTMNRLECKRINS